MRRLLSLLLLMGCCLFALAQTSGERDSFEAMRNAANLYLLNGDYSAARAQYEGIFKLYGQYEEFTKLVRPDYERSLRELDKIASAKKESERLSFSEPFVNFTYTGEEHYVVILAGRGGAGKWEVESCPEWCKLSRDDNKLTIAVEANPKPSLRTGEVTVKMTVSGKVVTRGLPVLQVARPLEERSVRIITEPANAQITIGNDPTPRTTPLTIMLQEGEIPVHIMRQDYTPLDTFIQVSAEDDPKGTKEYLYELVPHFSLAKLNLKALAGRLDNKNPKLYIGDRLISLEGYFGRSGIKSLNSAGTIINRFEVYQNGSQDFLIPLEPATYTVTVTADDFEDYNYTFTTHEGETTPLDIILTPKRGVVRFFKGRNAEGVVIKDGSTPLGTLNDQLEVQLTADDHKIYFEKENFLSESPVYSIHINPGEAIDIEVNMDPQAYINISSQPAGSEVIINGLSENLRTPVFNKAVPLGQNVIVIKQNGYYAATITKTLTNIGETEDISVNLSETHPLSVISDAFRSTSNSLQGFNIYLTSADDRETLVAEYDKYTDSILEVPYGKYNFEFRRYSIGPEPGFINGLRLKGGKRRKDLAYKGTFVFNEGHNVLRRMSYSEYTLDVITGNYMLSNPALFTTEDGIGYSKIGDAGLLRIPLWPGFSTSIIHGIAYKADSPATNPQYMFGGSVVFLNGEQRIGLGVHQYADVCLLATYSWLPQLHTIKWVSFNDIGFNYVNGKDLFFGIEVGTRFPVINSYFRVGYSIQSGYFNFFDSSNNQGSHYNSIPYSFKGITASVSFSLSDRRSKGAEILRVYYI